MSNDDTALKARRTNTVDGSSDPYDHVISLLDTTLAESKAAATSGSSSPNKLTKRATVTSVRELLAQRKYAKWQQEKFSSGNPQPQADNDEVQPRSPTSPTETAQVGITDDGSRPTETETTDFALTEPDILDRGRKRAGQAEKKPANKHGEQAYEVDILYENQRGLFFFGIPLYSHSSLLNFDPAPWVTKDLKDSAVDITNAQVPDPSWQWAWQSWYVDMSHDVDEEGWQYSFSFGRNWAWHGTHPWFHSYVRRRRWLRKRIKRQDAAVQAGDHSMHASHNLTADYFTIHPRRDRSPASTLATTARASFTSQRTPVDNPPDTVDNIANLLHALRLATIDREKIDLVKNFLDQGGEELAFLAEHIPEIVSLFVFQMSRRQLLELLQREAASARKHREQHDAEDRPEGEAESRRIDSLVKATRTAASQIGGLEYWSDRKHILHLSDEAESPGKSRHNPPTVDSASVASTKDEALGEVRGISEGAELDVDPTRSAVHPESGGVKAAGSSEKGKGKADSATVNEEDD